MSRQAHYSTDDVVAGYQTFGLPNPYVTDTAADGPSSSSAYFIFHGLRPTPRGNPHVAGRLVYCALEDGGALGVRLVQGFTVPFLGMGPGAASSQTAFRQWTDYRVPVVEVDVALASKGTTATSVQRCLAVRADQVGLFVRPELADAFYEACAEAARRLGVPWRNGRRPTPTAGPPSAPAAPQVTPPTGRATG
jgi:hypothetical protein